MVEKNWQVEKGNDGVVVVVESVAMPREGRRQGNERQNGHDRWGGSGSGEERNEVKVQQRRNGRQSDAEDDRGAGGGGRRGRDDGLFRRNMGKNALVGNQRPPRRGPVGATRKQRRQQEEDVEDEDAQAVARVGAADGGSDDGVKGLVSYEDKGDGVAGIEITLSEEARVRERERRTLDKGDKGTIGDGTRTAVADARFSMGGGGGGKRLSAVFSGGRTPKRSNLKQHMKPGAFTRRKGKFRNGRTVDSTKEEDVAAQRRAMDDPVAGKVPSRAAMRWQTEEGKVGCTLVSMAAFSVAFPAIKDANQSLPCSPQGSLTSNAFRPPLRQRRRHRVPLDDWSRFQSDDDDDDRAAHRLDRGLEHDAVVSLLERQVVPDVITAMRVEMHRCTAEVEQLERDRAHLEENLNEEYARLRQHREETLARMEALERNDSLQSFWNIDDLLYAPDPVQGAKTQSSWWHLMWGGSNAASKEGTSDLLATPELTPEQRVALQEARGVHFAINMDDKAELQTFISLCRTDRDSHSSARIASFDDPRASTMECVGGGAGIRNVVLLGGTGSSFIIIRDNGKSIWYGDLPPSLNDRLLAETKQRQSGLRYVASGPCGSYYAELTSGECWWGLSQPDDVFVAVLNDFDVHRVAFGEVQVVPNANENDDENDDDDEDDLSSALTEGASSRLSWIVVGRDGRVAWKNLPSRLHRKLKERAPHMAAIAEVSLGPCDSYFVSFLDGETDYCLPSSAANTCERIEALGGKVTNISLHIETADYIVRHANRAKPR